MVRLRLRSFCSRKYSKVVKTLDLLSFFLSFFLSSSYSSSSSSSPSSSPSSHPPLFSCLFVRFVCLFV